MALKDTYYTISEAAKKFGITRQTLSRWIASGEFPVEKIGRETLIKKREIKRYMNERRMMKTAIPIVNSIVVRVREKYNYTDEDKVVISNFDKKKAIALFHITKEDGTREIVSVSLGNPEPFDDKGKSVMLFGFQIPIQKIERIKTSK